MVSVWGCIALVMTVSAAESPGDLADAATIVERTTHRSSSYDRSGGNEDAIVSFAPGTAHVLLDADGPGRVTHIWMTLGVFPNHATFLRDLVLRAYWERSEVPSVEVPLGDFFALGHGKRYPVQSIPVAVGANLSAMNCYWPMPFYKHGRIEICNVGGRSIRKLYYHVDYELGPIPRDQGLFHAAYHREKQVRAQAAAGNTTGAGNYVILDTVGEGQYVGCVLSIDAQPGGWWGEGDDMIFVDDDDRQTIQGTGSEDYFCNAWGYDAPFCYPFYGAPLLEKRPDGGSLTTVYRWHLPDPIRFRKRLRVTIEHVYKEGAANDYASVAFWYQRVPVVKRDPLPRAEDNYPRVYDASTRPTTLDLSGTELEAELRSRGVEARSITADVHEGYKGGGWLRIDAPKGPIEIAIPVPDEGTYRVTVKPVNKLVDQPLRLSLKGGEVRTFSRSPGPQRGVAAIDLGRSHTRNRTVTVVIEGACVVGIDAIHVERTGP